MLNFGIYPGGLAVDMDGLLTPGPPEDAARIDERLGELRPHLVRGYVHYGAPGGHQEAPPRPARHAGGGRRLDLVACFREPGDDLTGWLAFLRGLVRSHGDVLATLQVGEEANHDGPGGDGGFPQVRRAIVEGVLAARDEVDRLGLDVLVGCNSTPVFDPAQDFWSGLGRLGGREFAGALGLCRPGLLPRRLPAGAGGCLRRRGDGGAARLPRHQPRRGGYPRDDPGPRHRARLGDRPGPFVRAAGRRPGNRGADRARAVGAAAFTTYEHFSLRDADSGNPDVMFQFGLVRSDYTPKPAFARFRDLIAELGPS